MRHFISGQIVALLPALRRGFGLGLGLIFLTLIGIPSDKSEELAALTLPIFLLLAFWFGWIITRSIPLNNLGEFARNSTVVGLMAGIILIAFMGQVNRWHANGIDVRREYFEAMNEYPVSVLSGVPKAELFPNPEPNPLTGDYDDGAELRTNPMKFYTKAEYALVSVAGLHIGGFYGCIFLLGFASLMGGATQNVARRVNWTQTRQAYQQVGQSELWHWFMLSLPLLIFAIFWLTIPQNDGEIHVIDAVKVLNLDANSLIDESSIQLGLAFGIIVTSLLALRRVRANLVSPLAYTTRVGLCLGLLAGLALLGIWRIQTNDVTFFAPSFDIFDITGHQYSLLSLILVALGLAAFVVNTNQDPTRFEFSYVVIVGATTILLAPLYMDQSQTFVMGWVGLTIMFGLGLNIVIGYAGLLDLGYVAFYAIGAYTFAFLAIENDRNKVPLAQLNELGWLMLTGMVIAPLVLFGLTNLWHNYAKTLPAKTVHPRIKAQSRIWEHQPPAYISLVMVLVAVACVYGVQRLLVAAGIFEVYAVSSFLIAIVVSMLTAAFTGFLLGVPILRLRGDYLAIVTLGFGEIISLALQNFDTVTGGPQGAQGIPKPVTSDTSIVITNLVMLYLSFVGILLVVLISTRLRNSRLGRAWMAMHSDEDIAQAMGINLVNVKLLAFSIGASFAGLAGMVFASRQSSIFPEDFTLRISINVLALVIIGGMGSIQGVVLGSIVLIGLPELLRPIQEYRIMAFGLLLIVTMIALPSGLMPSPPPTLEAKARQLAEEEQKKQ